MNHVTLNTERTQMKFPLAFLTPRSIVEAIGDQETVRFMSAVPSMNYSEEDAKGFMEFLKYTEDSDGDLELGIFDKATNKFIGMCSLENINRQYAVCELGYWLDSTYVGKGYMTECAKALVQYAKTELDIKFINAYVITEHTRSIHLLERLGFVRKERLKNDAENKGKPVDRYWYQLTFEQKETI